MGILGRMFGRQVSTIVETSEQRSFSSRNDELAALLSGGVGSVLGTIGGVAIFAVLDNVMSVLEVNPFLKDFIRGAVIVLAVALYAWRSIHRRPPRFLARKGGDR